MAGVVKLDTKINGRPITGSRLHDPFELNRFPGVVNTMKGRTLDALGKDISSVARMLAHADPNIEDLNITYTIEDGDLVIHSEETHSTGYETIRRHQLETGEIYRSEPKQYLLRATMSVLNGRSNSSGSKQTIATDIVANWRRSRGVGGRGGAGAFSSFSTMAGMLAVGAAYMSGIPI